ncbi:MAG TPA: HD domain-containing protein [Thermoanaerobaculia bacterium]|nr:HD domain-containing protein [Thermoanaerobaculia bacterium]
MATVRNSPIRDWREGDMVQGFALLTRREQRQDRKGNTYLDLELRDASGVIGAKVWADSPALEVAFEASEFVAFEGAVQRYREQLQLVVRHCRRACEDDRRYGFDEALLVPTSKHDLDQLWERLQTTLDGHLQHPLLRRLAEETLETYGAELKEHPAAKTIHHAYRGGLLEHVVDMAELAVGVSECYPDLDRDLLLLGVLYHDLGKILELGAMPANDYTRLGRLVGHIVLGRDLLRARCAAIPDFPEALQLHLEHLVLSHQGQREWGSPVEPMTPEALALHFIDDLDSKLNQLRQAQELGVGFQYLRPLGRHVWLGEPKPPAEAANLDASGEETEEAVAEEPPTAAER